MPDFRVPLCEECVSHSTPVLEALTVLELDTHRLLRPAWTRCGTDLRQADGQGVQQCYSSYHFSHV